MQSQLPVDALNLPGDGQRVEEGAGAVVLAGLVVFEGESEVVLLGVVVFVGVVVL